MTVADTTFFIDVMRGDDAAVATLALYEAEGWALHATQTTLHELHRGIAITHRPATSFQRLIRGLQAIDVLATSHESARIGGQIDGALRAHGAAIDPEDCMIAGVAIVHGMSVLTRNVAHFERIAGLQVQTY